MDKAIEKQKCTKNFYIIYRIVCKKTKEIYVGISKNFIKRRSKHMYPKNEHSVSKQIIKRGHFIFELLDTATTKKKAEILEKKYIKTFARVINKND